MRDCMFVQLSAVVKRAPIPRKWPNGKQSVEMTAAITRRWQSGGEWFAATTWIMVECWGSLAARMLGSEAPEIGDRVLIIGQQQVEEYEDDKRRPGIRLRVTASVLELLNSRAASAALADLRTEHDAALAELVRLRAVVAGMPPPFPAAPAPPTETASTTQEPPP